MKEKKKQNNQKFPWYILWMIPLYFLNLILIVVFQCVFIHTENGPLDEKDLKELEFFENTEILDVYNTVERAGWGQSVFPAFVLYRTDANETKIVRIEWNAYVFRYGIEKDTVKTVSPKNGEVKIVMNNLWGTNRVTVKDGTDIISVGERGPARDQSYFEMIRFTVPWILMIIEYYVYRFLFKIVHK